MLEFLWRASWQGSALVLAVWLVSRCLPGIPARSRSWVWWLASIKFAAVALILIVPLNIAILPTPDYAGGQRKTSGHEIAALLSTPATTSQSDPAFPRPFNPSVLVVAAWLAGVGVCAVRIVGGYARLRRILQTSAPLSTDEVSGVRVLESCEIGSPMVVGPFRPAILVPTGWLDSLTKEERAMAFRHEMAHVQGKDLAWGLLPDLATTVFFFLPTAWLARREWIAAREEVCDAEVIAACGVSPRRYGELLLKVASRNVRPASIPAMGALSRNSQLKQRLTMLKNINQRSTSRVVAPIVGAALLVLLPWQVVARNSHATSGKDVTELRKETLQNLKVTGLALAMYRADYDDYYPHQTQTVQVFTAIGPYLNSPKETLVTLNPAGSEFKFNSSLSGVLHSRIESPARTIEVYDPKPWPGDVYLADLADGHAQVFDEQEWGSVRKTLTKRFKPNAAP